jgi:microcystin degradation protein MlrC
MSNFRIGIGRIWTESNTFSSLKTTISDFCGLSSYSGVAVGAEVLAQPERKDEVNGFVKVLSPDSRVEIVPLLSAGALPSGPVTGEAVSFLEDILRRQLRQTGRLDGVCFALHGAMSGTVEADLDGYFLQVIRDEVGPYIPIVCSLDCHAVVTRLMVDLTTALIAYRTHPHVDLVETGMRTANLLLNTLGGKIKPVLRYQKIPLLLPPPDDGTRGGALKDLFDEFIAWDKIEDVIACSLCPSFAWQDVPEQGWTALAITDDDETLAQRLTGKLAVQSWKRRNRLLPEPLFSPEAALRKAAAAPGCPVIVTDSADNIGGGASGDTTTLLKAALEMRHEVAGLILIHLPDPQAISRIETSQCGDVVTVKVGGKRATRFSRPLSVTGQVLCITKGRITDDGKFGSVPTIDVGKIVCLAVDNVRLVLTEGVINGPQPSLFRKVGLEPFEAKIVTVKSGNGWKVTYGHKAGAVFRADCPGAFSYNLHNFDFKHVPRPIFPLDKESSVIR